MFLSLWISVCKSKPQPNQTSLNITILIWHCFLIFADLCFCFQPFFIKKGFPTPSELEERAGFFFVLFFCFFLNKSPSALTVLIEEIIYWGRTAVHLQPRCFTAFRGRLKNCISQNCRTFHKVRLSVCGHSNQTVRLTVGTLLEMPRPLFLTRTYTHIITHPHPSLKKHAVQSSHSWNWFPAAQRTRPFRTWHHTAFAINEDSRTRGAKSSCLRPFRSSRIDSVCVSSWFLLYFF